MGGQDDSHHYLARLRPGGHDMAVRNLARQGFDSFMPTQRVTRRRAGRLHETTRPLFQGYLFVRIPPDQAHWRSINSTYGVAKLVTVGTGLPTEVPAAVIGGLRARLGEDGALLPEVGLKAGDRVRMIAGPFADTLASIETLGDADRIIVLMDMMGQSVRATVGRQDLERV